jgi:hypothetical protein
MKTVIVLAVTTALLATTADAQNSRVRELDAKNGQPTTGQPQTTDPRTPRVRRLLLFPVPAIRMEQRVGPPAP